MPHTVLLWFVVAAFFGAGLFNAIGTPATQSSFVRWGYPPWWCRITGGLEMANAVLIALPATFRLGVILGAVIIAAALLPSCVTVSFRTSRRSASFADSDDAARVFRT